MEPTDLADRAQSLLERRTFMAIISGGFLAAPLAAGAQQAAKVPRIGYLWAGNLALREAFLQGLRDLGYVEGRNIAIEYRDHEGKYDRLPPLSPRPRALEGCVVRAPHTTPPLR